MNLSILFFIISNICYAITDVLWKKPIVAIGTLNLIVARSFCTSIVFGIITAIMGDFSRWNWEMGIKAIAFCFINFFGLFFYLKAMKEKSVSEIVGISKISVVIGIIIGIIYFNENFSIVKLFVIMMILLCVFLVENYRSTKTILSKGFLFVLLSCIFWSTSFLFKEPLQEFGIYLFSFILETTVCATSFLLLKLNNESFNFKPLKNNVKDFIGLVILGLVAILAGHYVVAEISTIILAVLRLLSPLTTLVISHIYLREQLSKEQCIGIGVGIIGLVLLTI